MLNSSIGTVHQLSDPHSPQFSSVQFSRSIVFDSLWPHGMQHTRLPCSSPTPGAYSDSRPLSWWCHPSHPLSSPSPPAFNPSQHQGLFQWVNSFHQVAKVLEFQLQHHSLQRNPRADLLYNGLVGSPCSPRDSQESSPTPQFKSINFQCSAFFIFQLSYPYMTTRKSIALTRQIFLGKIMSAF